MNAKWTKGPWKLQPGFLTVYTTTDPERGTGLTIALAQMCRDQVSSVAEAEANGLLMSAAPELAEACGRFAAWFDNDASPSLCPICGCHRSQHLPDCPVTIARDALAKANGGAA